MVQTSPPCTASLATAMRRRLSPPAYSFQQTRFTERHRAVEIRTARFFLSTLTARLSRISTLSPVRLRPGMDQSILLARIQTEVTPPVRSFILTATFTAWLNMGDCRAAAPFTPCNSHPLAQAFPYLQPTISSPLLGRWPLRTSPCKPPPICSLPIGIPLPAASPRLALTAFSQTRFPALPRFSGCYHPDSAWN